MDKNLRATIKSELIEIEKKENFKKSLSLLKSLQRHLVLLGRENRTFTTFAADLAALIQSQTQWSEQNKTEIDPDQGFYKSFAVLKATILEKLS